jgi:hypothetical protein
VNSSLEVYLFEILDIVPIMVRKIKLVIDSVMHGISLINNNQNITRRRATITCIITKKLQKYKLVHP